MKTRSWVLCGLLAVLAVGYVCWWTDWLRPTPIEIASQVRVSILRPSFGQLLRTLQPGQTNAQARPAHANAPRAEHPELGTLDQAPGGVANVTFSLDARYRLTRIRVEDVPADGSAPQLMWEVVGKSHPLNSLLYGRVPQGMKSLPEGSGAEPLKPGVPYRLILESGRHRGTNHFRTIERSGVE